jgi:hypothetical protein
MVQAGRKRPCGLGELAGFVRCGMAEFEFMIRKPAKGKYPPV